jgi:hypothetical protein
MGALPYATNVCNGSNPVQMALSSTGSVVGRIAELKWGMNKLPLISVVGQEGTLRVDSTILSSKLFLTLSSLSLQPHNWVETGDSTC